MSYRPREVVFDLVPQSKYVRFDLTSLPEVNVKKWSKSGFLPEKPDSYGQITPRAFTDTLLNCREVNGTIVIHKNHFFATCQYQGHLNSRSSDLKWDYTAFWWGIDRSNQRTHTCNRSRDTDKWFLAQKWLYLKNHFACTGGRKFEVHRVRC